ncbi:MAG TPA: carboxypeptidase regulatory-like domain-containing protein [Candidatus Hypogeohydataceae bacterium YC41]
MQHTVDSRQEKNSYILSTIYCLLPTFYCLLNKGGFTLLTVIIILTLMGVAAGIATTFIGKILTERRELTTEEELMALKEAIIGNPSHKQDKNNFGYLGNMGNLPVTLQDLYMRGDQPGYILDPVARLGAGWAGPYITPLLREELSSLLTDAFGNIYEYTTTEYIRADGEIVSARILSYGDDKKPGTEDDKEVEILRREIYSTVSGFVTDSAGTPIGGAPVTLYYPYRGSVHSLSITTNVEGLFQFTNVPNGIRTVKAAGGGLRYVEGSALATGENKDNLTFKITNWGEGAVTLNSIRLVFTLSPAYYEEVYVGSTRVFNYLDFNGQRGTSNRLINFSDTAIHGGENVNITRVPINSDNILLPNIVLYPRGGTLLIKYVNFKNDVSGPSSPVSVYGASFTVTFSNGSQFSFIAQTP